MKVYLMNKLRKQKLSDKRKFSGVVWSSEQAHVADAMAPGGDEGRTNLRKAQASR